MDLIEQYIEGKLQGEALTAFEARLNRDALFRKEVEEIRTLIEGIRYAGEQAFARKVQEWENAARLLEDANSSVRNTLMAQGMEAGRVRSDQEPAPAGSPRRKWLPIAIPAAAAIILLVWGIFALLPAPAPQELYAVYFQPYPDLLTTMSVTTENQQPALTFYNQGDYETAAKKFEEILQQSPQDDLIRLYLGVSQLQAGHPQQAIHTFEELMALGSSAYTEPAQWYKALAYLKAGQLDLCRQSLEEISHDPGHDYHQKAKKLLRALK